MILIFYIFIALIVFAPLPFGMVHSLYQALSACLALTLATVYMYTVVRFRQADGPAVRLRRIWPETAGFILVMIWGLVQISPWTPQSWHHPLWAEAGLALGEVLGGSISLVRGAGFETLMRLFTYATIFYLALQFGRDRKRAATLLWAMVAAGTLYAVYGLVIHFSGYKKILWLEKTHYIQDVTGPFVNRNSFATYLGFTLLGAAGLYLDGFFRVARQSRIGKDRTVHLLQQAFVRGAPLLAGILILLTALFLTHSRAGVTVSLLSLLSLLAFLTFINRFGSRFYRYLSIGLIAVGLWVFLLSGEGWLARLTATELERENRSQVYEQTWQAIEQSPWTGYGLGSYEQTFPLFADERTVNTVKAHNDWLEMMFELGLPAAAVWFAVLAGLSLRCLAGFFRRWRDHIYPAVGFCAAFLVGLHALVDFSLQIPAVAVTFAVLLGVGVAQGWSSAE